MRNSVKRQTCRTAFPPPLDKLALVQAIPLLRDGFPLLMNSAQPSRNQISLAFSLRPWRLRGESAPHINRQDSKSAKNFAKQNSFQESKDFQLSTTAEC